MCLRYRNIACISLKVVSKQGTAVSLFFCVAPQAPKRWLPVLPEPRHASLTSTSRPDHYRKRPLAALRVLTTVERKMKEDYREGWG